MYLILRVFDFSKLLDNSLKISGNYFNETIKKFPEIKKCKRSDIKKIIMYMVPSDLLRRTDIGFYRLNNLIVNDNSITVEYEEDGSVNSNVIDKDFDRALYGYLMNKGKISKGEYIPTFVLIDEDGYEDVLRRVNMLRNKTGSTAEELKRNNDWNGLLNFYFEFNNRYDIEKYDLWNDYVKLSDIAFAASKLGELGKIDKVIIKDREKREKYLDEARQYREFAKKIYERCLQIDKEHESRYLEGLAYLNYNYVLNAVNYKRLHVESNDKILENFNDAANYFKEVINMDNKNIKSLYRLGYLYVDIAKQVVSDFSKIKQLQVEGAEYLLKVIMLWENLDNENEKKRCRNEYVKSHYVLGVYYLEECRISYNNFKTFVKTKTIYDINVEDFKDKLKNSRDYLEKCLKIQLGKEIDYVKKNEFNKDIIEKSYENWSEEAVDIFYRLGLLYFYIYVYLILIKYNNLSKQNNYINLSVSCFKLALKLNWKEENKSISRDYIEERLSRVYIALGKYDKAIQLLIKYKNNKNYINNAAKGYIFRTLEFAEELKEVS